jgi:endonuclease G
MGGLVAKTRRDDKEPYRSLCRDKRVLDALRERFASGRDIPGFGDLESKGVSPRKFEEVLERGPYEGAAINALEAIILLTGRPALLIQDGEFLPPELDQIRERLEPRRKLLRSVVPSVARLDVLSMSTRYHMGTAWMLDEDIMITNRHVANSFAREQAGELVFRRSPSGIPFDVDVDFRREYQRDEELLVEIEKVLYIEPDEHNSPDMAIVRVRRNDRLPQPLIIADDAPEVDENVATIGYPGDAPRTNNPTAFEEYFDGIYGVKRLAPGRISSTQCGPYVFNHDCTTLGGNSGSCVIRLETGEVLGLHFAGVPEENNWAVSSTMLRQRLSEIRGRVISTVSSSTPGEPAENATAGHWETQSAGAQGREGRIGVRSAGGRVGLRRIGFCH